MLKKMDLEEFGREIIRANGNPGMLDDILIRLSGWYAYYSEQFIRLEHTEAIFHQANKKLNEEKPPSDKSVDAMWKVSEEGQDHTRTKQTLKTLEKLMSNIKSSIRRAETESRNLT